MRHTPSPGTSPGTRGATVWFTGLPSAGKSTVARALADELTRRGRAVEVLDGDEIRRHLSAGLGFSRQDRDANVARIGFVARLLARHGVLVLVPVIAPYAAAREEARKLHEADGGRFLEVYVATSLDACRARDVKGLYELQRTGRLSGLTGVDDPYEVPTAPDLRLETEGRSVRQSVADLDSLLAGHGLD